MRRRKSGTRKFFAVLLILILAGAIFFTFKAMGGLFGGNSGGSTKSVYINEYMSSNHDSIKDEDGNYSDWIELYNPTSQSVSLKGYFLSDDEKALDKWTFPDKEIKSKEYLIVYASGKDRKDPAKNLHTNFAIDKKGQLLLLSSPDKKVLNKLKTVSLPSNVSYGRDRNSSGNWLYYMQATPGRLNDTKGEKSLPFMNKVSNPAVYISEVMVSNDTVLQDEDKEYTDWVEFYNSSDKEVSLKGYGLTNTNDDIFKWQFPDVKIAPKSYLVVYASGKNRTDPSKNLHMSFNLNKLKSDLYFREPDGKIIDDISVDSYVTDVSYGRSSKAKDAWVFYSKPTPGEQNSNEEYKGIISYPDYTVSGGFYDKIVSLELKPREDGSEIRYTTDGSTPGKDSLKYTGPITLDKTTIVRAVAYKDGYIQRPSRSQTYFINDKHTLPVVSVAVDPKDFSDPVTGIYSKGPNASSEFPYTGANFFKDTEIPAHFEYFDADGKLGYRLNCGLQIFGGWTRGYDEKSLAIYARSKYENNSMNYKFLVNKNLLNFKDLVLRTSGQDVYKSKMRDILISDLIKDSGLDYMGYQQSVLYINGQYWGVYNLREKMNDQYFKYNYGITDLSKVDFIEGNSIVKSGSMDEYNKLMDYVKNHDLKVKANYDYVASQIDIKNYIDFQVVEMYAANTDAGNIRYWKERKEGAKWRWMVYDMDMSFGVVNHDTVAYRLNPAGTGAQNMFSTLLARKLLENPDFRQLFLERFAYHMKNTFKTDTVLAAISKLSNNIKPEIQRNAERWGKPDTETWNKQVFELQYFAQHRNAFVISHLKKNLNLSEKEMKIFADIK